MRFFGKGLLAAIRRIHPELYHVVKCGGVATEERYNRKLWIGCGKEGGVSSELP